MSFQSPLALIGLVLVPVLVGLYVFRERRRQSYAARFGTPALLPNLVSTTPGWQLREAQRRLLSTGCRRSSGSA